MNTYIRLKTIKTLTSLLVIVFLLNQPLYSQLFINEWMASNDDVIADNYGEYDDWIEVYNAGASSVDLAGYYMSDGSDSWQIPSGNASLTTVPAGGFLLLWADDDTDQGEHHLGFKLSANGEQIILFQPDGSTIIDEVTFGPQNTNTSSGRAPDGSATIEIFINATPGISNDNSSGDITYNSIIEFPIIDANDDAKQFESSQGWMNTDGVVIYMTQSPTSEFVGLRFQEINIPQGATINNAYIQFNNASSNESMGICDLTIHGEDVGNATAYTFSANDIFDRAPTSESVDWTPPDWGVQDLAGLHQRTPSLQGVVQEIVDRSDWSDGNAMSFVISGSGTRVFWTYDSAPEKAPKLIIELESPAPTEQINNLVINEIAARGTSYTDAFGDRDDWIEFYNNGSETVNLGGLFLTDDLSNLTKWQISSPLEIAPNDYGIIWADKDLFQGGLHADFNLSGAGEDLALVQIVNGAFQIIDQVSFGEIPFEATYGRETDGANTWVTFGNITPDASNNGAALWLAPPVIALDHGLYSSTQTTSISHIDASVDIRYTTDGSEPTAGSPLYSSELTISSTQSLRAKAFKAGNFTESPSAIKTYLFVEDPNLPVLYINTDPDNFFDDQIGIYVVGTNGIPGYCDPAPRNYCQEWTRPVNITLFEPDGAVGFNVNAGMKIGGGCSRNMALRSLNIGVKEKKYGSPAIDYPLYEGRNTTNFERLKLRNSGQDFIRMGFRDAAIQALLWDEVDMDLQGFKPVIVYINQEYWGILNLRELYTDEYFEHVHNVKKEELDLIKNPGLSWKEIKVGDDLEYLELYDFLENNDLSNQANYDYAESKIDVNEFLNYWISSIYIAANDWPANNQVVWREKKDDAKWRWGMFDNDNSTAINFGSFAEANFNTLDSVMDASHTTWPFHSNSTVFFRNLMDNIDFRGEYIQRTCTFSNIIFDPTRVNEITDGIKDVLDPEVDSHLAKWGADNAMGGDYDSWQANIQTYKDFFPDRQEFMESFINSQWSLNGTYELTLNYDQNTGGTVVVNWNDMNTPFNYQGKYFKDIPLRVKAIAKQGYTFLYWLETGDTNPVINFVSNQDAELTPIFQIDVNLGDDIEICEGENAEITTGLDNCTSCSFDWSNNETSSSITVSPNINTMYTVAVTDPAGGITNDTINVLVSPTISVTETITDPTSGQSDGSISLVPSGGVEPFDYDWNVSQNGPNITSLPAGIYSVTIQDAYDCEYTATYEIGAVSTKNISSILSVDLYPNPNNGVFQIDMSLRETQSIEINIFNAIGTRVFNTLATGRQMNIPIDLDQKSQGLYMVEIRCAQESIYKKLLLKQ